jgi:hypothetical protein
LATFKCEWIFFTMAACQKPTAVSVRRWCPGGLLRSGSLRSPALRSPSGHYPLATKVFTITCHVSVHDFLSLAR